MQQLIKYQSLHQNRKLKVSTSSSLKFYS